MTNPDLTDLLSDYNYDLPDELIAHEPAATREAARLLVVRRNPERGLPRFEDLRVSDLPDVVASEPSLKNALWVRNRSRVIPARFYARRPTGGRHEIVLTEEKEPGVWDAIIRGSSAFKYPQPLAPDGHSHLGFQALDARTIDVRGWSSPLEEFLEANGEMPLPPYIKTRDRTRDRDRYQTVWARPDKAASVAAPTASLHFSDELTRTLETRTGASFADIILHVGLGTFEPVRTPRLSEHTLHDERIEVEAESLRRLETALTDNRPRIALGTTALRTLESLGLGGRAPAPEARLETTPSGVRGRTHLFIRPGHEFRYANSLFTNFHLPESTLLVLVATFAGSRQLALEAYRHAIENRYRFFSFGDASLWI